MKKYYRQQIIVGTKQTVKALKNGEVKEIVIAEDADPRCNYKVSTDS